MNAFTINANSSTTATHTPGPWIQQGCSIYTAKVWREGIATGDKYLASSAPIENMPSDEDFANARLIAAAPDLLEVLKDIGAYRGEGGPNTPWQAIVRECGEKARAAIAKATGETK